MSNPAEAKGLRIGDVTENLNRIRVPLSGIERKKRQGPFRYYGAQGVIDHIDDYLFDGEYVLIAEDGENLRSRKQPIAFCVSGKFWVNNHAHILKVRDDAANARFVVKLWVCVLSCTPAASCRQLPFDEGQKRRRGHT